MGAKERVRLFSSGSEWEAWTYYNCTHCIRQRPCALEEAVIAAYWNDGTADESVARRLGLLTDGYDERCEERVPTPELAAYDAHRLTLPRWRIERGDGYVPVDGIRWSVEEAHTAIARWNDHPSYDPKYQYKLIRVEAPNGTD